MTTDMTSCTVQVSCQLIGCRQVNQTNINIHYSALSWSGIASLSGVIISSHCNQRSHGDSKHPRLYGYLGNYS